jgi:hypothetical protein
MRRITPGWHEHRATRLLTPARKGLFGEVASRFQQHQAALAGDREVGREGNRWLGRAV